MHLGFLLFELLVSSLLCIPIHSLKSGFTFPLFQSSGLLDNCSLLVFEAFIETFVVPSLEVALTFLKQQYLMNYSTPNNQSVLWVHPQNVYLLCLMEGRRYFFSPANHMLVCHIHSVFILFKWCYANLVHVIFSSCSYYVVGLWNFI